VVAQGGVYACSIITARILGQQVFGQFAMVQSTVASMVNFTSLGLGTISTRCVSQLKSSDPERLGRTLGLSSWTTLITGVISAAGLMIFAPYVARGMFHAEHLAGDLRVVSLYLLFLTMNVHQSGAMLGFEAFRQMARLNLMQGVTAVVCTLLLVTWFGLRGAVLAVTVTAALVWLYYQKALRSECASQGVRVDYSNAWAERDVLSHMVLPASLSGGVGWICVLSGNVLLARLPDGFSQMALYTAANTMRLLIVFLPQLTTRVVGPILCNLQATNDTKNYRKAFWMNLKINTAVATVGAIALAVAAPLLLSLFGKGFSSGGTIAGLLLASSVVEVAAWCVAQAWYSHGKFWWAFGSNVAWGGCLLLLMVVTVPKHGAVGLAFSYLVAWVLILAIVSVMAVILFRRNGVEIEGPTDNAVL